MGSTDLELCQHAALQRSDAGAGDKSLRFLDRIAVAIGITSRNW